MEVPYATPSIHIQKLLLPLTPFYFLLPNNILQYRVPQSNWLLEELELQFSQNLFCVGYLLRCTLHSTVGTLQVLHSAIIVAIVQPSPAAA